MAKDHSEEHLENCLKQPTQVIFLSKFDITFDIRELLQQFTMVYPNGLSEPHHQAQKLERSHLTFPEHSFITTINQNL